MSPVYQFGEALVETIIPCKMVPMCFHLNTTSVNLGNKRRRRERGREDGTSQCTGIYNYTEDQRRFSLSHET